LSAAVVDTPIELTVTDERHPQPVLETRLPGNAGAGIRKVNLADYKLNLEPGVVYEWAVALVADPNQRSKDIVTAGAIERVSAPESLTARLKQASPVEAVSAYAEAGIFYDAFAAASEAGKGASQDGVGVRLSSALLEQVGLGDIAAAAGAARNQ